MLNTPKDVSVDDKSVFDNPMENWIAGGAIPEARNKFYPAEIQYNQLAVDAYSCTLHATLTAISSLTGEVFGIAERKKLWKELLDNGIARKGWGAVTSRVVNYVYKHWNNTRQEKLNYFTESLLSDKFFEILDVGYTCVTGGAINRNYHNDVFDGKLDHVGWSKPTYGHVFCITKIKKDLYLVENYEGVGNRDNTIEVTKEQLQSLRSQQNKANKIYFYNSVYYFMYEKEWQNADIKVSTWAEKAKAKAEKKGIITDWTNPKEKIAGEKMEWILEKLGLLDKNQHEGFVTLEQYAVVLDRLNLLD